MADRTDFLLEMYKQLCAEIDRHIKATWQNLGVLLSTFAIFALIEKKVISPNIAVSILIAVCAVTIAMIVEANFWYNRNLVIIANIERQFLEDNDAEEIHYYFLQHRKDNAYLAMMKLQIIFVSIILAIVLIYHLAAVVAPTFSFKNSFNLAQCLPYIVLSICTVWLLIFNGQRKKDYNTFRQNSPGKDMTTALATHQKPSNSDHKTA